MELPFNFQSTYSIHFKLYTLVSYPCRWNQRPDWPYRCFWHSLSSKPVSTFVGALITIHMLTYISAALPNSTHVGQPEISVETRPTLAAADTSDALARSKAHVCPDLSAPTSIPFPSITGLAWQHQIGTGCVQKRVEQDAPWGNGAPPAVYIASFPYSLPYQSYKDQCSTNSQLLTRMIQGWIKSVSSSRGREQTYDPRTPTVTIRGGACITTTFKGPADQLPMYRSQAQTWSSSWPARTTTAWGDPPPPPWRTTSSLPAWPSSSLPVGSRSWGGNSDFWGNNGPVDTRTSANFPSRSGWSDYGWNPDTSRWRTTSTVFVTIPPSPTSTYVTFK
jgi:hypothetical protein